MTDGPYRDSSAVVAELRAQLERVTAERDKLEERMHYAGLDLPDADTLPTWVAPYTNWWGTRRGSCCPGCGCLMLVPQPSAMNNWSDTTTPRTRVHACDFIKGIHVHVTCSNCRETTCWKEGRAT